MNLVHLDDIDGTDPDDLTRGEIEGRRQAMYAIEALRRYTPGCAGARLRNFGMTLGIRDTRKIDAAYNMTERDVRDQGRFADSIGIYPEFIDGYGILILPTTGRYFQIPYRNLVPRNVSNLLVAGRSSGGDRISHAATRNMSCCAVLGQGAGIAAALSVRSKRDARIRRHRRRAEGARTAGRSISVIACPRHASSRPAGRARSTSSRSRWLRMYCWPASVGGVYSHGVYVPSRSACRYDAPTGLIAQDIGVERVEIPSPCGLASNPSHYSRIGRIDRQVVAFERIRSRGRTAGPGRPRTARTSSSHGGSSRSATRHLRPCTRRPPPAPRRRRRTSPTSERPASGSTRSSTSAPVSSAIVGNTSTSDTGAATRRGTNRRGAWTISGILADPSKKLILYQSPRSPSMSP